MSPPPLEIEPVTAIAHHLYRQAEPHARTACRWFVETITYDRDCWRLFLVGAVVVDTAAALATIAVFSL